MPQYHNQVYTRAGKVHVTPRPFWRRILKFLPYYVGDTVKLNISVERLPEGAYTGLSIYESFGGAPPRKVDNLVMLDYELEGHIIDSEGDVRYSLGPTMGKPEATIFTAAVINKDKHFSQWFWTIVGLVLGLIVSIIGMFIRNAIE